MLVVIEHHSRRLTHFNVTAHPTAHWTRQQLREAVGCKERYEYLLHARDAIFSAELDESIRRLGRRVLKSPARSPKESSICERVIGTIRRECLDWVVPLSEAHLRQTLKSWVAHYKRGPPHSALGPGVPDPLDVTVSLPMYAPFMAKQQSVGCTMSIRWRVCDESRSSQDCSDEIIADETSLIDSWRARQARE